MTKPQHLVAIRLLVAATIASVSCICSAQESDPFALASGNTGTQQGEFQELDIEAALNGPIVNDPPADSVLAPNTGATTGAKSVLENGSTTIDPPTEIPTEPFNRTTTLNSTTALGGPITQPTNTQPADSVMAEIEIGSLEAIEKDEAIRRAREAAGVNDPDLSVNPNINLNPPNDPNSTDLNPAATNRVPSMVAPQAMQQQRYYYGLNQRQQRSDYRLVPNNNYTRQQQQYQSQCAYERAQIEAARRYYAQQNQQRTQRTQRVYYAPRQPSRTQVYYQQQPRQQARQPVYYFNSGGRRYVIQFR